MPAPGFSAVFGMKDNVVVADGPTQTLIEKMDGVDKAGIVGCLGKGPGNSAVIG